MKLIERNRYKIINGELKHTEQEYLIACDFAKPEDTIMLHRGVSGKIVLNDYHKPDIDVNHLVHILKEE